MMRRGWHKTMAHAAALVLALSVSAVGPLHAAGDAKTGAAGPSSALPPITVTLNESIAAQFLRVAVTVEMAPGAAGLLTERTPALIETLSRYFALLNDRDLFHPHAIMRARAEVQRRAELVLDGQVERVFITEFLPQ